MSRTQKQHNTRPRPVSRASPSQLPLRVRGPHLHDAHGRYPPLEIIPPHTARNIGNQCKKWAGNHPAACGDPIDIELLDRIAYLASIQKRRYCSPTQAELADHLAALTSLAALLRDGGISTKTIQRRLRRLAGCGALRIERRYDRACRHTVNHYFIPG